MTEEARAKRAAYMRQWRKLNPDKVKDANRRYWEKKAEEATEERNEQGEAWDEQTKAS